MIRRHKYLTISILLSTVLLIGSAIPLYMRTAGQTVPDTGSFTPQPNNSHSRPPVSRPSNPVVVAPALDEHEGANCTYPVHYWQIKPDAWPAQVALSGQIYTKETIRDLYLVEDSDPHTQLIQHMYTAFLNILHGAEMVAIEDTLLNAQKWLEDNPPGSQLSEFNLRQNRGMVQVLVHYNNGDIGPGACEDAPEVPTPTPLPTAMEVKDIPEKLSRPQEASPTAEQASRAQVQAPATVAPFVRPTDPPPIPPPAPANTLPPPPTNTPLPPPTDTPPPPPTNTPLPPPTDTPPPPPTDSPPPPSNPQPSPTNTSPPPPTNTPPPPAPPNQHPQGLELASKYGVSYEEIMGWNAQGFGFGEIDRAYELAKDTGNSVSTIFEMRASGMGWGQIRKALQP
jgi:hypothetical protein